jgi:hypothetical protein
MDTQPGGISGAHAAYRPARPLGLVLVSFLVITGVIGILVADLRVSEIHQLVDIKHRTGFDTRRLVVSQRSAGALQGPGLVALVGAVLTWLAWQVRVHRNTMAFGSADLRFASPAAAVGAWAVPGANAVLPALAIREAWRASDPERTAVDWRSSRTSAVVYAWWVSFLGFTFLLAGSVLHWAGAGATPSAKITRDEWLTATGLWCGVTTALAVAVVMLLDIRQEERDHGSLSDRWTEWSRARPS